MQHSLDVARAEAMLLSNAAFAAAVAGVIKDGFLADLRIYTPRIPGWQDDLELLGGIGLLHQTKLIDLQRIACSDLAKGNYTELFSDYPNGHEHRSSEVHLLRYLREVMDPPGTGEEGEGEFQWNTFFTNHLMLGHFSSPSLQDCQDLRERRGWSR